MKRSDESSQDYFTPPVFNGRSSDGIIRVTRDPPPAHYLFKINSFSLFAEAESIENFESGVFEAGGYKWRLLLYPNGNKKSNGGGFISLYMQIAETETLPLGWQINVNFKLFVFDQIRDKYLTIEDAGVVKRFHQMKTEWGFDQLLLLECFNDTSNGYLVNDSRIFGAEVFVIEHKANWEDLSMIKQPAGNPISFKIENFSKLEKKRYDSPLQTVAGLNWKLLVYPYGDYSGNTALSLFLSLAEASGVPPGRRLYVKYKLRLMDQVSSNHKEILGTNWFIADKANSSWGCSNFISLKDLDKGNSSWGCSNFISLEDLCNASKGFLRNDALTVQAEIILTSKPSVCPKTL